MTAEVMGTVEQGALKLDQALPFPDHTRVKLTIEPVEETNTRLAAWKRLLALFDEKPIVDGKPFNREELYDRR
jgi:DUF1680 family protein